MKPPKLPFYPLSALTTPGTKNAVHDYAQRMRQSPADRKAARRAVDALATSVDRLDAIGLDGAVADELRTRNLAPQEQALSLAALRQMRDLNSKMGSRMHPLPQGRPQSLAVLQLVLELATEYRKAGGQAPEVVRNKRGTTHVYEGGPKGDFMAFVHSALDRHLPPDTPRPSAASLGYHAKRALAAMNDPDSLALPRMLFW